jgi:hypothetical protein
MLELAQAAVSGLICGLVIIAGVAFAVAAGLI